MGIANCAEFESRNRGTEQESRGLKVSLLVTEHQYDAYELY